MEQTNQNEEFQQLKRINEQLIEENEVLRTQLRALQIKKTTTKFSKWFAKRASTTFMGRGLKESFYRLYTEIPKRNITKETLADLSANLVWRFTRIGMFAFFLAVTPILVLIIQTQLMNRQTDMLEKQTTLLNSQTELFAQQISQIDTQNVFIARQNDLFELQNSQVDSQNVLIGNQNALFFRQIGQIDAQNSFIGTQNELFKEELIHIDRQSELFNKQTDLFEEQINQIDKQNLMIEEQTHLSKTQIGHVETQNELVKKQTESILQQTELIEAERRSSGGSLMGTILDRVDAELQQNKLLKKRQLSPELIGRIAALSQSFKPYRYLQNDSLIAKPISPEKGQLLLSLIQSKMDHKSSIAIYNQSNFDFAELTGTYLVKAYLNSVQMKEANLERANLTNASLKDADLVQVDGRRGTYVHTLFEGAYLNFADMRGGNFETARMGNTDLSNANFSNADLRKADLSTSKLQKTNLNYANLEKTKMQGAKLIQADMNNANLQKANLREAMISGVNLRNADLRDADLANATIIISAFGNSVFPNLEGAKVSSIDWLEALSQNAIVQGKLTDYFEIDSMEKEDAQGKYFEIKRK